MTPRKWCCVLVSLLLVGGALSIGGHGEKERSGERGGEVVSVLTSGLGKVTLPSAVKNFEFCVPPQEEMLECLLPRPGMAMIYPYEQRGIEDVALGHTRLDGSDSDHDDPLSSPLSPLSGEQVDEPEPEVEDKPKVISKNYVRIAVRDMENKVQVFTIGEFLPDLSTQSPTMSYQIMGRGKFVYTKFGEAVLAVMSIAKISDDFVSFPIYECGTQWADEVGVMGAHQRYPEGQDEYTGTDGRDATTWCMIADQGMAKCYLKYYEFAMEKAEYTEPMSVISRKEGPDSYLYSTISAGTVTHLPRLVYLFDAESYQGASLSGRPTEKPTFGDIALWAGEQSRTPNNPAGLPDWNCGGRTFYSSMSKEYFERIERAERGLTSSPSGDPEQEQEPAWVLPPSWKAAIRGLTMAMVLEKPDESEGTDAKNEQKLKDIDPAMRMKCEQFFESRGIPVQMGTDMGVDFDSVKGNKNAKKAMYDNVITPYIMQNSDQPRNVLQYGPPGTGKSLLAKALVSELTKAADGLGRTDGVTYLPVTVSTFESMWKGQSQENVRTLFDCARAYSPSVVFIDECDSLFASRTRGGMNQEYSSKVKGEFLVQMDGSFKAKKGDLVVIVAATNRPQDLDSAFRRRLPVNVFVGLPVREAREAIIDAKLGAYMPADYKSAEWWEPLLESTKGYSGSDLVNFCKEVLTDAETKSLSNYMTTLPASIKEKIAAHPRLAQKVEKFGPFSVLLDLDLTPEEMTEYISSAKGNLKTSTKVATGLTMADAQLMTKALGQIKRSVTREDMVELFDFMTELGGIALNDVPQSYRNDKARSTKVPSLSVNDLFDDPGPRVLLPSRKPKETPEEFWAKAVRERPSKWVNCDHE